MQLQDYRTAVISNLSEIAASDWENLRKATSFADANPFLAYAYLDALEKSGSAVAKTGWHTHFLTVWLGDELHAAMPLYLKSHSYGEYVFDWAWANAYEQHHLPYYPKLLSAVPFTPVTGARLLARNSQAQKALLNALTEECRRQEVSSCHVLFPSQQEAAALHNAGFMLRYGVQFHWNNAGYRDFSEFLAQLEQKKRKNIQAERRKVREAGIRFVHKTGLGITEEDWRFFAGCYQNTYQQHGGGKGYLNLDFFLRIGAAMPDNLLMIIAYRDGRAIAASLLFYSEHTVYGRYWGCMEYHPCLHFETAYYQPLEFCIAKQIQHFEGGAQGEHKMARGFLPQTTFSAHWLAHPAFSNAVDAFLEREQKGVAAYINELHERNPFLTQE